MTSKHFEAIIIGGGQAGLSTAYYLLRAGVDTLVLDDQEGTGGAWRHVWPSMTLFSTAEFSSLPGKPPSDHVIDYLADYEQRYRIPVERPVHVDRVEREDGGYRLHAGDRSWTAPHVVAATGTWSTPFVPAYPGLFTGTQWHSANRGGPLPGVVRGGGGGGELRRADRGRTHRCCRSHLVYPPSTTVDAR